MTGEGASGGGSGADTGAGAEGGTGSEAGTGAGAAAGAKPFPAKSSSSMWSSRPTGVEDGEGSREGGLGGRERLASTEALGTGESAGISRVGRDKVSWFTDHKEPDWNRQWTTQERENSRKKWEG